MHLRPLREEDITEFSGTPYDGMPPERQRLMISESMQQSHGSLYFEVLAACEDNAVVGFTSLSARSEHIISCSPAIKTQHQGQGLGFAAETQALAYAKRKGYTIAVATIDEQNAASIALHEKLGFELAKQYRSKQGTFRLYAKAL